MNFEYAKLFPIVLIALIIIVVFDYKTTRKFQDWVEKYWFFKFKKKTWISKILYFIGISIFAIALLDLRGPAEKFSAQIPKQKTVMLIDTSMSMMAEDVRPSRMKRAIMLSRHLVKKLAGHKISILLFSDLHKKLVPFTTDIDLLDSRLAGLNDLNIRKGGTNLSAVLMETLHYLKDDKGIPSGNIILISDAEENEVPVNLDIPDSVTVAMVAVGTKQGGKIPIRGASGMYIGSKRFKGKEVISKIDEATIKRLSTKIKNFNYWMVNSYNLPSAQIRDYLDTTHNGKFSQGEVISKPVFGHYLTVSAILFLILSYLLKFGHNFIYTAGIILLLTNSQNSIASGANGTNNGQGQSTENEKEDKRKLSELGEDILEYLKTGKATKQDRLKLAEEFLTSKFPEKATVLYKANLNWEIDKSLILHNLNYGTAQVLNKKTTEGIDKYIEIFDLIERNETESGKEMKKILRTNTLLALAQKQQQQQQQKQDKEKKEDQNQNGGGGGKSDKDKDKEKEKNKEKDQQKKDQENKDNQDKQKDQKDQQPQNPKQEQKQVKVPALLKQLKNDDRQLQGKLLDTRTHQKRNERGKKDW